MKLLPSISCMGLICAISMCASATLNAGTFVSDGVTPVALTLELERFSSKEDLSAGYGESDDPAVLYIDGDIAVAFYATSRVISSGQAIYIGAFEGGAVSGSVGTGVHRVTTISYRWVYTAPAGTHTYSTSDGYSVISAGKLASVTETSLGASLASSPPPPPPPVDGTTPVHWATYTLSGWQDGIQVDASPRCYTVAETTLTITGDAACFDKSNTHWDNSVQGYRITMGDGGALMSVRLPFIKNSTSKTVDWKLVTRVFERSVPEKIIADEKHGTTAIPAKGTD